MNFNRVCQYLLAIVPFLTVLAAGDNVAFAVEPTHGICAKVEIGASGVYQLTYDELRSIGFSNPAKVGVFGFGGLRFIDHRIDALLPDSLPPVAAMHCADKLMFYAQGVTDVDVTSGTRIRNAYASTSYYFLAETENPEIALLREAMTVRPDESACCRDSHDVYVLSESESQCPSLGGVLFVGPDLTSGSYVFQFEYNDAASADVDASYAYVVNSTERKSVNLTPRSGVVLTSSSPGRTVGMSGLAHNYYSQASGKASYRLSGSLSRGLVELVPRLQSSVNVTFAAPVYAVFHYKRKNTLATESQQTMLLRNVDAGDSVIVDAGGQKLCMWDVSRDDRVKSMTVIDTVAIVDSAKSEMRIVAFDPLRQLMRPLSVEVVPSRRLMALEVPDMLVITTDALRGRAEELAEAHRQWQGLDVAVVTQSEVFDEFTGGTPHPVAFRRFCRHLYKKNPVKFKALLLYGGGSYDNRSLLSHAENRLLTYQCEVPEYYSVSSTVYCADSYFGCLADDFDHSRLMYQPMTVAVGRIPVLNDAEAESVNGKLIARLGARPSAHAAVNMLALADSGDSNSHVVQADATLDSIAAAGLKAVTVTKIYDDLFPLDGSNAVEARRQLQSHLESGVSYLMFCGHGNMGALATHGLWTSVQARAVEYSHQPFVMLATCNVFGFDRYNNDFGSEMLRKHNGGCIALVASGRDVYQNFNQELNVSMAEVVAHADGGTMLGEIYRRARNLTLERCLATNNVSAAVNTLCYNFGGDPMVAFNGASQRIDITSVNGNSSDSDDISLHAQSLNTVAGRVISADGAGIDVGFNGEIELEVFESPHIAASYNHAGQKPKEIVVDDVLLTRAYAQVVDGEFVAEFVVPQPVGRSDRHRMVLSAVGENGVIAAGTMSEIAISAADGDREYSGNEIVSMTLDGAGFTNGDCVGATPELSIEIALGEAGINQSRHSIGQTPSLMLDGERSVGGVIPAIRVLRDYACVRLRLPEMSDGRHSLCFAVCDNLGRRVEREIEFVVRHDFSGILSVESSPVRSVAVFSLSDGLGPEAVSRIVVEDADGRCVFAEDDVAFPYSWNLQDNNGIIVSSGYYRVFVQQKSERKYGATDKIGFVVFSE